MTAMKPKWWWEKFLMWWPVILFVLTCTWWASNISMTLKNQGETLKVQGAKIDRLLEKQTRFEDYIGIPPSAKQPDSPSNETATKHTPPISEIPPMAYQGKR